MSSIIEWEEMRHHQELEITLIEDDVTHNMKVKIVEIEWAPNRTPFIADVEITDSDDAERWYKGMVLRLPVHTTEKTKFLVKAPKFGDPNRELNREAEILIKIPSKLFARYFFSSYLCIK